MFNIGQAAELVRDKCRSVPGNRHWPEAVEFAELCLKNVVSDNDVRNTGLDDSEGELLVFSQPTREVASQVKQRQCRRSG